MKEARIIKRYQNRKLYDTFQSCYVTLEEIAHIVREGNDIQVIDNKTKDDITYMTQIQLLFDQERKSVSAGDTELLKEVIRGPGGTFTGFIRSIKETQTQVENTTPPSQMGNFNPNLYPQTNTTDGAGETVQNH